MRDYLTHTFNPDDPELVSIQDELPLWSAPFGLKILDTIIMKQNITILDIGPGTGFPVIDIAQRFGSTCKVYGLDPWKPAIERAEKKIKILGLTNVQIKEGFAENIPFDDSSFDLIVSNNGINNVADIPAVFKECFRTARSGAQFVFTFNLSGTMKEFYDAFKETLAEFNLHSLIEATDKHIYKKRKPVEEVTEWLKSSGFSSVKTEYGSFTYRFADAEAALNYSMIKYWFLPASRDIIPIEITEQFFKSLEEKLNNTGEVKFTVPFVLVDCFKASL